MTYKNYLVILSSILFASCGGNSTTDSTKATNDAIVSMDSTFNNVIVDTAKNETSNGKDSSAKSTETKQQKENMTQKTATPVEQQSSPTGAAKSKITIEKDVPSKSDSKNKTSVIVFKLGSNNGTNQSDDQHILGFKIVSTLEIPETIGNNLIGEIANKKNRLSEEKRCPFKPNYAVMKDGVVTTLIASRNCPKMLSINGSNTTFIELKEDSGVAKILNEL